MYSVENLRFFIGNFWIYCLRWYNEGAMKTPERRSSIFLKVFSAMTVYSWNLLCAVVKS